MAPLAQATGNPLAALLQRIRMRPEQLIARVNEHRARRGSPPLDLKSAYPWLRDPPVRPAKENEADALTVLSTRAGRTVTAAELGWTGPRRRRHPRRLDAPCEALASELLHEITQGDHMDRRHFMLLTGTAVTAPALALLIGDNSPAHAAESSGRLSPELVTTIENSVRELRVLDDNTGSTTGLVWAGGLWQSVSRVVLNARSPAAEGRRLRTAFIELSELYGWMLFDADQHPQAQRVYQTGMRLAHETDLTRDTGLATRNLLASAAYQASWLSQHTEAKTLLDIAGHNPRSIPPRVQAVIADRQIFAAGRRGDTESLRRARDTAHDQLQATGADEPWWARWLSHPAIDAATGRAWLAAHQPKEAEPFLTRRLEAARDTYPRDRMLATLDLADTHRLTGDHDAAVALIDRAASLAHHVDSQRAQVRLHEITTAFATPPSTRARRPGTT
ncbi:XRE family transcriptional regulator [Streptomyces luteireticuli]|uniref:XRE family transcriptional regulator n=1 Tax=Streptomyces luteireticuli TaxID=173858 RepID=UPI003558B6D7